MRMTMTSTPKRARLPVLPSTTPDETEHTSHLILKSGLLGTTEQILFLTSTSMCNDFVTTYVF